MNRKDRLPVSGYADKAAGDFLPVLRKRRCNRVVPSLRSVLLRDVLPRRGEVVSARAERLLMAAGRLLDDARGRPSLREADRKSVV